MGNANYETILLTKEDGIATVYLNRPEKLNAVDSTVVRELGQALREIASDTTVRVVIITGKGRAFCAGGDLDWVLSEVVTKEDASQLRPFFRELHDVIVFMRRLEKPIIAAVNGPAVGAGADLAMACDIRIAADTASFGEVYARIGVLPDTGGTYFLPRLVGVGKACELIFTGDIIDAKEAERIRLVNKVVPLDKLEKTTKELATRLANGPTIAIGLAKTLIYRGLTLDLDTALDEVVNAVAICFKTKDLKEGTSAFLEKRKPVFTGE